MSSLFRSLEALRVHINSYGVDSALHIDEASSRMVHRVDPAIYQLLVLLLTHDGLPLIPPLHFERYLPSAVG